jgi:hypothetical protein
MTEQQLSAFEMLQEKIPSDLVPGFNVNSGDDAEPQSAWIKAMKRRSKDLGTNAFAYFNYVGRGKRLQRAKRKPTKILSADGFPPWVTVVYAYPPPQSFYTPNGVREVKHMVLHSFGHGWMASYLKGRGWRGWMNSKSKRKGVQIYEHEGKTVYVPKGSDENLHHPQKFSAGLSACLNSSRKASAHFFIDRSGNLAVIGDVNDILFTSNSQNKTGVGVELEEAFYVEEHPSKKTAQFKSGGNPPGTAGNVVYVGYSPLQLLTLSILCKKIEIAFPAIAARNLSFERRSQDKNSPPGYSMHDFIKGSTHFDVSPQFLEQRTWDLFFNLVDANTHINTTNIWKPRQKYTTSGTGEALLRAPEADQVTDRFTRMLMSYSHDAGVSIARSSIISDVKKATVNDTAGKQAVQEAQKVLREAATTHSMTQQASNPPRSLPSANIEVAQGVQAQTSDYW